MRRESGYPLKAKDVTTFVTPFAYFTVLRTTPEMAVRFVFVSIFHFPLALPERLGAAALSADPGLIL